MTDEWSRCPICYEDYSLIHRPTTFLCGHSTCIDHTFGPNPLRECPICRHSLNEQKVYNVSYNLEEASRFYHMSKTTIDYSTIKFPSANNTLTPSRMYEEIEAEEVETRPKTILAFILAAVFGIKRSAPVNPHPKICGHCCFLTSTSCCFLTSTSCCCSCSDQRSHSKTNQYDTYIDGYGIQKVAQRNQHYCPSCKQYEY